MTEAYKKEGMHDKMYDLEQNKIWCNAHLSEMDPEIDVWLWIWQVIAALFSRISESVDFGSFTRLGPS